jgi:hypothetical protein
MGGGRLRGVGLLLAACLAVGAVAAVCGVLFEVIRGGTTLSRSVAYALWIAAALALVLMLPARSKLVWRSSHLPPLEGWWFVTASTLLTVAGAIVDAIGGA